MEKLQQAISLQTSGVVGEYQVHVVPGRDILTLEQIDQHLAHPETIRFVQMKNLLSDVEEGCIDGRCSHGTIGTAGGNMGLFVELMTAIETVRGGNLDQREVSTLFLRYLSRFGKFFMHTDGHASRELGEHLDHHSNAFGLTGALGSVEAVEAFVRTPLQNKAAQKNLLALLVDPRFIGCGHLKQMMLRGGEPGNNDPYGVRPEIVAWSMEAFYQSLWTGNTNIVYETMRGRHAEGAVLDVVIVGDADLTEETWIPLVQPHYTSTTGEDTQMFVHHPQVERFMREQTAQVIVAEQWIAGVNPENADHLCAQLNYIGNRCIEKTANRLAKGLPYRQVEISLHT